MPLKVNEIFYNIQGESSFAGRPCVFIRLSGCNLRCSYCDTQYAYQEGQHYSITKIIDLVDSYGCPLVEVTGGEPLMQNETPGLVNKLLLNGFQVIMETNGSMDISKVSSSCIKIMDIKCPSSGEQHQNDMKNIDRLSAKDEIKFVILDRNDFDFARHTLLDKLKHRPLDPNQIHFSPVYDELSPHELAKWLLDSKLNARLQLQLHKYIWDPNKRGV